MGSINRPGQVISNVFPQVDNTRFISRGGKGKGIIEARVLVMAGGGGGGARVSGGFGGAGGAGGLNEFFDVPMPRDTTFPIVVGAGGVATAGSGTNGGLSSIASITVSGGGFGAGGINVPGGNGGSGGSRSGGGGAGQPGGTGIAGQGHNAGATHQVSFTGGGGGAGSAGGDTFGQGLVIDISGAGITYARGGSSNFDGGVPPAQAANLGWGGTGNGSAVNGAGGAGGSGVLIIRYPGAPIATGGVITDVAGDTVHTFNASGDFVIS